MLNHPVEKIIIRLREVARRGREIEIYGRLIGEIALFLSVIIITDNWLRPRETS